MLSENNNIKKITVKISFLLVLGFFLLLTGSWIYGDKIQMPGNLDDFGYYITYNYSVAGEDLMFHINELLLFEEIPTFKKVAQTLLRGVNRGRLLDRYRGEVLDHLQRTKMMTYRHKLPYMFQQHRVVRDLLLRKTGNADGEVTFDLNTEEGTLEATRFMKELGIRLTVDTTGRYKAQEIHNLTLGVNQYYKIQGINAWKLYRQLNKEKRFTFKPKTFELEIPFKLDFLSQVTGAVLKASNFAHELVHDRRLQILMGILFRLSDKEIGFISQLAPDNKAWQKIYQDNTLLSGMFVLCHGLRVKDGRLRLPGGKKAASFWQGLTGHHPLEQPFEFLQTLLAKDNGKLNYFYTLGYFLSPEVQNEIFHGFDAEAFKGFYQQLRLSKKERLGKRLKLPGLDDNGIFALFFALRSKGGKIYFPGGTEHWAAAMGAQEPGFQGILKTLTGKSKKKRDAAIKRFLAIYSKFIDRGEILTPEVLRTLFHYYDDYNVLIDYIEQLPLKKPSTVTRLFKWADSFMSIEGTDKILAGLRNYKLSFEHNRLKNSQGRRGLCIAVFQSLLGILCHGARYMPGQYDYDELLNKMMDIPSGTRPGLYDGVLDFLDNQCGLDIGRQEADRSLMNFFMNGIGNKVITLNDQEYILDATNLMETEIKQILEKQGACKLSDLARVNQLLNRFGGTVPGGGNIAAPLVKALEKLPLTGAEDSILSQQVTILIYLDERNASPSRIKPVIRTIKEKVLLPQLKHLLVTGVYALNGMSSDLRVYSNPYFTRLHDFTYRNRQSPWNSCKISLGNAREVLYHIEGGLSRLRIVLSAPFGEQLCHMVRDSFSAQTTPIIYNNLDLFPITRVGKGQEEAGKLVQRGMDLLKQAETNPQLAAALKDRFAMITSGYHYRKIIKKLEGKQTKYFPYFRELLRLGEESVLTGKKAPGSGIKTSSRLHLLGSLYSHSFGRLRPYRFGLFPQAVSQLFREGIIGGEMNNELKIKAAYVSHKRGVPPELLGYLAYRYLVYVSMYYSQKFPNDFYKTYFVYNIYNHLYMNRIINTLKRAGVLKLK